MPCEHLCLLLITANALMSYIYDIAAHEHFHSKNCQQGPRPGKYQSRVLVVPTSLSDKSVIIDTPFPLNMHDSATRLFISPHCRQESPVPLSQSHFFIRYLNATYAAQTGGGPRAAKEYRERRSSRTIDPQR